MSDDGRIETFLIKTTSNEKWFNRMEYILSSLDSILDLSKVSMDSPSPIGHVIMESYAFAGSSRGFVLGELGGIIKYHFFKLGFDIKQIAIAHHKMYVTRKGNSKKPSVIAHLKKRFEIETKNDNIADAISMALLYRGYINYYEHGIKPDETYDRALFARVKVNLDGTKAKERRKSRSKKSAKGNGNTAGKLRKKSK